jgi:hypothetical protein
MIPEPTTAASPTPSSPGPKQMQDADTDRV